MKILRSLLPIVLLLITSHAFAQEQSKGDQTSKTEQDLVVSAPDLSSINPTAAKLSGELAILENRVGDALDLMELEKKYAGIRENLKGPAAQLQQIKDSEDVRLKKILELRKIVERENELFNEISKPLNEAIRQFGAWRNDWLAEKQRWNAWQSILLGDADVAQLKLKSTFEKAKVTIDRALEIVLSQLNSMLAVQEGAGNIQAKIISLITEFDSLILDARSGARAHISPPMFSSRYFSQLSNKLLYSFQKGIDQISWPDSRFFERHGLIVFFPVCLSLLLIIAVYRNRQVIKDSKRWWFLSARPFSAGLFFGSIMLMLFYEYQRIQDASALGLVIVAGICFARLIAAMNPESWKRQFVYGLISVLIVTRLLYVIMFPLPLFRIYTVITASVGLFFCLRWARESGRHTGAGFYRWALRAGAFLFAIIIMAEISGKQGLSEYLFISLIRSTASLLGFMLLMYLIRGLIDWMFHRSSVQQTALFSGTADAVIRRATIFIDVAISGLVLLPGILYLWGAYDSFPEAIKGVLALGFSVGTQRITLGLVIFSAAILYVSFLASWMLQKFFMDKVLAGQGVETGVRVSIARLVHYILIFAGFLVALFVLGFEFTKITILLSALGVGIGFGLQTVVNNFVSGLILLFERPVRVGDFIEIGGKWAEIKNIGLRATTVQTLDQADVIIPNADLVANQVINWTLSNRRVRLIIPVGVAYGSDVSLVMETLMTSATECSNVAKIPAPQVLYLNFGQSSLDFELRVWVLNAEERLTVISELHQEIDRRFREAKIEIAFPQQDLHLRSVDESVIFQPKD